MQQAATFIITVESQQMQVRYRPRRFFNYAHYEFMSIHNPPRRIPLSETGYLSHFSPMHEIEAAPSAEKYAQALAAALIGVKSSPNDDDEEPGQLALFE